MTPTKFELFFFFFREMNPDKILKKKNKFFNNFKKFAEELLIFSRIEK